MHCTTQTSMTNTYSTADTIMHAKHDGDASEEPDTCLTDEEALIAIADSIITAPTLLPDCNAHDLNTGQWTVDSITNVESDFATLFLNGESDIMFVKCITSNCYAEMRPVENMTQNADLTTAKSKGQDMITLPEHVNVLFLQTIANKDLGPEAENGLKQLL